MTEENTTNTESNQENDENQEAQEAPVGGAFSTPEHDTTPSEEKPEEEGNDARLSEEVRNRIQEEPEVPETSTDSTSDQ